MVAIAGARERARREVMAAITEEARRQLAVAGAAGLSLRAVARELGMVSSGIYRYVTSRDELLTALIVDAYDSLGDAVEASVRRTARRAPAARFLDAAREIRRWALANPHEYALLYGSPVPGYTAPRTTVDPSARTTIALVGIVAEAHRHRALEPPVETASPRLLGADLERVRRAVGAELPDGVLVLVVAAWTQLFGMVSFELFGQTATVVERHEALFDATVSAMTRVVGL